jgi:hypothetical protein
VSLSAGAVPSAFCAEIFCPVTGAGCSLWVPWILDWLASAAVCALETSEEPSRARSNDVFFIMNKFVRN